MPRKKATSCLKALALFSLLLAGRRLPAQESQQAQPAMFLKSNDRFGASLLNLLHVEAPDRNIAIAPLPVSLDFAALLDGSHDSESNEEIVSTFSWGRNFSRDIAGRMLLARFERPKSDPDQKSTLPKAGGNDAQG